MPKIIVNEHDDTRPGSFEFKNFKVVVPGYVEPDKYASNYPFNEDYICELDTQAEFDAKIGQFDSSVDSVARPPIVRDIKASGQTPVYKRTLSEEEFNETYKDSVYTFTEAAEGKSIGRLCGPLEKGGKNYEYTKADAFNADTEYCVLSYIGRDSVPANPHYGNQIAYELLGLGYKVIYVDLQKAFEINTDGAGFSTVIEALRDKSKYDFRYIVSGYRGETEEMMGYQNELQRAICSLVTGPSDATVLDNPAALGRGDCIALLDVPEYCYVGGKNINGETIEIHGNTAIVNGIKNGASYGDKYAAWFAPSVEYAGLSSRYTNKILPASFHYLACAKTVFNSYNEWYAVAGLTRGVSTLVVNKPMVSLGEIAINALQPRTANSAAKAVNIVADFRKTYYMWGNRTAHPISGSSATGQDGLVASNFLNIRQLCTTIKKQVYMTCRNLTFDPNSDTLWMNFCSRLRPTLELMKADQGIRDYQFIKKQTSAKAVLLAAIKIVPIEAVEDFCIDLRLTDSITGGTDVEITG